MNCLSQNPIDFVQSAGIWQFQDKTFRIVSVPILLQDIVVGTLSTGFEINPAFVQSIKANTNSDVVFVANGRIIASTLTQTENEVLLQRLEPRLLSRIHKSGPDQAEATLGGETYLTLRFGDEKDADNFFFILNSIDRNLKEIMNPVKITLILIGVFSILISILLGLALSQSITRPLMNFVNFMGSITRTGELQQKFNPQKPNYEARRYSHGGGADRTRRRVVVHPTETRRRRARDGTLWGFGLRGGPSADSRAGPAHSGGGRRQP
jgi:hypothetical protein